MDIKKLPEEWGGRVVDVMTLLWDKVAQFLPNLLGMLVILILGYLVSKILERVCRMVLTRLGLDTAASRVGIRRVLDRVGVSLTIAEILARLVFWFFMLTFIISAAETLGLENVSKTIELLVGYLPNLIAAVVIVVIGLLLAHFVREVVYGAAEGVGVEYAKSLASLAHIVLLVIVGSLAVSQLQVQTELINRLLEIVLIAMGVALAVSLGLGSREVSRNLVAGIYARDLYRPGMKIVLEKEKGLIEEVGAVTTRIRTARGELLRMPNSLLIETVIRQEPE